MDTNGIKMTATLQGEVHFDTDALTAVITDAVVAALVRTGLGTPAAPEAEGSAQEGTDASDGQDGASAGLTFEDVDQGPEAVAAAEALARGTGWTLPLAVSWCEDLANTRNGRVLHEVSAANDGYATAAAMRGAAGRSLDGANGLSGFTGGVAKRFKGWRARTAGAQNLHMPVETDYDPEVASFQRARGFRIDPKILPLFRIALTRTRA